MSSPNEWPKVMWCCVEPGCTYWRQDESTGVHMTFPTNGPGVAHSLERVEVIPAQPVRALVEEVERHADMPAGESWEDAYNEVVGMVRAVLSELRGERSRT